MLPIPQGELLQLGGVPVALAHVCTLSVLHQI